MFTVDTTTALTVPDPKVVVRHEVEIVWPDGRVERVCHDEDVTALFREPSAAGKHEAILASLLMSRVNTRLNFAKN